MGHGWQEPKMKNREMGFSRSGQILKWMSTLFLFLALGCEDGGNGPPGTLRFGQVGDVTVHLEVPLTFGESKGQLFQTLVWNSSGNSKLTESIYYRTLLGDENDKRGEGSPGEYAFLIVQLHEAPGLKLFDVYPRELPSPCSSGETRVHVTVRDEVLNKSETWVRCSEGSLATLKTSEAGPDEAAVRVIQAAILVRDFTEGRDFVSAYSGSVPFGTLDKVGDSGARLQGPTQFYSPKEGSIDTPEGWVDFWRDHVNDPRARPPLVDWAHEMVVVAAVGRREEAGDSVEVRRVLQTAAGTNVVAFERIPGDFCSPAAREVYPIHIVVAPRTLLPVEFTDMPIELVPCGF